MESFGRNTKIDDIILDEDCYSRIIGISPPSASNEGWLNSCITLEDVRSKIIYTKLAHQLVLKPRVINEYIK